MKLFSNHAGSLSSLFQFFRSLDVRPRRSASGVRSLLLLFEVGYFGKKAYLSQSAQFYEEAALAGLEKVWICQPAFRAEKSRTAKHLTEFWMIEAERAFADQPANMRLQEELLAFIIDRVIEKRGGGARDPG